MAIIISYIVPKLNLQNYVGNLILSKFSPFHCKEFNKRKFENSI